MLIGVPSEIKPQEHRVGLVPSSVKEFIGNGHKVLVQAGAGLGINFSLTSERPMRSSMLFVALKMMKWSTSKERSAPSMTLK